MRRTARCLRPIGSHRYRTPRLTQQRQHNTRPLSSRNTRAQRAHVGQRKRLHDPAFSNCCSVTPTVCSTSPSLTTNSVVDLVMTPSARRRGIRTAGRSSMKRRFSDTGIWIPQKPLKGQTTSPSLFAWRSFCRRRAGVAGRARYRHRGGRARATLPCTPSRSAAFCPHGVARAARFGYQ